MRKSQDLKALFKEAAEIAAAVPKPLQEAAFNRALDALVGAAKPSRDMESRGKREKALEPESVGGSRGAPGDEAALAGLDRTAHPDVMNAPRVLERSLFLLRAARDELHIDGLGAAAIARALADKFRVRVTRQAIQQALDGAGSFVDRDKRHGRTRYRLMAAGDKHLDGRTWEKEGMVKERTRPLGGRPRAGARLAGSSKSKGSEKAGLRPKQKSTQKNAGGPKQKRAIGPKAVLTELRKDGYFKAARRIAEITKHMETRKGYRFNVQTTSVALVRMVREGSLLRERAKDGQYEYKTT